MEKPIYREYKAKELQGPFRCSRRAIYKWIASGRLESIRVGAGYRIVIRDAKVAELIDAAKGAADGQTE